ncbi:unnamed protein product [Cylicocyclus nassatus]|uniref:Peptidase C1A papain C-terminal domain-containing protein n=1 Tax=Cylicocyclus nassatus TaxID=53992 RepID=A0AA36HGG1_CYLNA|nr:unnamed protein product [Cylicocyclus nassatus]
MMFGIIWLLTLSYAAFGSVLQDRKIPMFATKLKGKDLVTYINKNQKLFTADFSRRTPDSRFMSLKFLQLKSDIPRAEEIPYDGPIPERFDAREKWPHCKSIQQVRDQTKPCASCWAVSAASVMSDRACIQSGGKIQTLISDSDLLSCCGGGNEVCGNCYDGGYPMKAWEHAIVNGTCSGGPYGAQNACKPYPFFPCGHHKGQRYYGECPPYGYETPKCRYECQSGYPRRYNQDKIFAKSAYYVKDTVKAIQKEIMLNGPVQACFELYDDFRKYKSGIYKHFGGEKKGGHAVKLIGWGVEQIDNQKVPYWIASNSENYDWGENGFFRIIRGENHCLIETNVIAGFMKV